MLKHADAILKLSLAAGLLLAGGGAGFYYGIYLPAQDVRRQTEAMAEKQERADRQALALAEQARRVEAAQGAYDDCINFAELSYRDRWTRSCQTLSTTDEAAYQDCTDDWFSTETGCRAQHPVRPARDCALPPRMAQQIADAREQRKAECLAELQAVTTPVPLQTPAPLRTPTTAGRPGR